MLYQITLNEEQMKVLKNVCELRFRIDLLQTDMLSEVLASMNELDLSPNNPNHQRIFDSYIDRREHIDAVLKALFEIASPYPLRFTDARKRDSESLVAEDIWQSIRYALYQNSPNKGDHYTVESREPMQVSDQPLVKIETIKP